jgi:hypothetical protein
MDTIAFLTLLLGLTLGPQTVRMSAADSVKRIEVRLDGAAVATLTAPPWQTTIDLGDNLAPHRVTAIAFDASGAELASIDQKVNVPRATSEARIVVEGGKARIIWKSVASRKPARMSADLDGVPVQIADDFTITLPPKLSSAPHVLRVTIVTTSGDVAEATRVIGASAAAEADAQLTAVPLEVGSANSKPSPANLLHMKDQAVKVAAVDAVPAEVIFVRAPSSNEAAMRIDIDQRTRRRQGGGMDMAMMQGVADRSDVHLGPNDTIRFLWPFASEGAGDVKARLFPSSHSMGTNEHGLRWIVANVSAPSDATEFRYADAVAVAGLQASASRRARAVVLIVGADYRDASALTPAGARAYLDSVGVPLYVWRLRDETTMPAAARAWGDAVDISTPERFRDAAHDLASTVARQRIAWVEGDYLPRELTLDASARDVKLLAR